MSKSEFLQNLRTARNLFFHRVHTDHPGLDPESVEAQLARAAIWLTPSAVKGFLAKDFLELPPELREELEKNVNQFARIAKQVPPTQPATEEQIADAMQCFLGILRILESYFPLGDESRRVQDALENMIFPEAVLTWNFELGADSTGDPAVWVWVIVDSETASDDHFLLLANDIQKRVRESLSAAGITRWPYIRFRTASEQRAL